MARAACNRSMTSARSRRSGATSSRPTDRSSSRRSPRSRPPGSGSRGCRRSIGRPIADADAGARRRPRHRHRPRRLAAALRRRARRHRTRTAARQGRAYRRRCHAGRLPVPVQLPVLGSAPARGRRDAAQHRSRRRRLRPARAGRDARARARGGVGARDPPPALRSAQREGGPTPRRPERAWCRTRLPSRGTSNPASWACSGRCRACCSSCCCCRRARTSRS